MRRPVSTNVGGPSLADFIDKLSSWIQRRHNPSFSKVMPLESSKNVRYWLNTNMTAILLTAAAIDRMRLSLAGTVETCGLLSTSGAEGEVRMHRMAVRKQWIARQQTEVWCHQGAPDTEKSTKSALSREKEMPSFLCVDDYTGETADAEMLTKQNEGLYISCAPWNEASGLCAMRKCSHQ